MNKLMQSIASLRAVSFLFCSLVLSAYVSAFSIAPGNPSLLGNPTTLINGSSNEVASMTISRRNDIDGLWSVLDSADYDVIKMSAERWRLTDKSVRISFHDPIEYQYLITVDGTNYKTWTSMCEAFDESANPLENWSSKVNDSPFHYGNATYSLVPLSQCNNPDNQICIPEPSESTTHDIQHFFHILTNDKYVAIFSRRGGLLALTHRTYGMEFQTALRNIAISALDPKYNCTASSGYSDCIGGFQEEPDYSSTYFDAATKNLIFEYKPDANNTHRPSMRAYWSLNSIGESGLAARLEVDPYTSGLKSILFPNMIGMGYDQNCIDTQGTAASCYSASVPSHASGVTQPLYKVISGAYQNSSLSAQFSSLNDDQYTLYIGSHDPAGFPKKYRFEAISRNRPTGIEHYLRNNNEITEADSFNVVVRPMCGNWQKSAKLYRRWATQQAWTPEPLAERTDVSDQLKQGMFWWTVNNGIDKSLTYKQDYLDNTLLPALRNVDPPHSNDLRIGIHDYNWHTPGFDHGFPYYKPKCYDDNINCTTANDWSNYLSHLQNDGNTIVMPYINGVFIDITNEIEPVDSNDPDGAQQVKYCDLAVCADPNEHGNCASPLFGIWGEAVNSAGNAVLSDYVTRFASGEPITATYNSKQCLAAMQMSAAPWQEQINSLATQNFNSGAKAQYLDSVGAGYQTDYSAKPGYPDGHSQYVKDGTKTLLTQVKAIAISDVATGQTSDRFIAAEHYSELYLKNLDLTTMYTSPPPTLAPLLPSVYSGYHQVVGMQLRGNDSYLARKYRLSLPFIWGYQLGLTTFQQLTGDFSCDASTADTCDYASIIYAYNLARARESMTDTFTLGQYLSSVMPASTADTINVGQWCEDQSCSITHTPSFPLLQAAYWRDINGVEKIIVTNPNSETKAVTLELPIELRGRNATCVDPQGTSVSCIENLSDVNITINVESLAINQVIFTQWQDFDGDLIDDAFDTDDDNDGIDDTWELEYGFNTLNADDADDDPDNDNHSNLHEFQQGTNPLVAEFNIPLPLVFMAALFSLLAARIYQIRYK